MNYNKFKQWEEENAEEIASDKEYDRKLNKTLSSPWWHSLIYIIIFFIFLIGLFTVLNFLGLKQYD